MTKCTDNLTLGEIKELVAGGGWATPSEDKHKIFIRGTGGGSGRIGASQGMAGVGAGGSGGWGEPAILWEPLYAIDSIPYTANAGGSSVHDKANLKPTGLLWNRESGQVKKETK